MSPAAPSLLETIFNDSLDVILVIDGTSGIIQEVNPAVQHMLGYDPDDLHGKHFSVLFPPDNGQSIPDPDPDPDQYPALAHGTVLESQAFLHASGSTVLMDLTVTMIAQSNGHTALLATLRDAGERRHDELEQEQTLCRTEQRRDQATHELAHVYALLHGLLTHSLAVIFAKDLDGHYILTNPQMDTIFAAEPGSLIGKTDDDIFPAEIAQAIRAVDRRVLDEGVPLFVEEVVPQDDGQMHTYASVKFPISHPDGTIYAMGGIATDITQRKEMEEQLRTSQQRLEHLLSASPVVIFSSRASGDFGATFVSNNIREVFGYEPHEFTDESGFWANHIHPDDAPAIFQHMHPLFEQGYHKHEYRFLHKNGSYVWIENHLRLIYDETGNPIEIVGSLQDVTERKLLEQAIYMHEQRLNAFFTAAPAGLALFDDEYRYINVNETTAEVNGVPREAHLGKTLDEVLPDLAPIFKSIFDRIVETGEPLLNVEVSGNNPRNPDEERHWHASYFPVPGIAGKADGIGVVFTDITARKQAEVILQESHQELEQRVAERTAELAEINRRLMKEVEQRKLVERALARQKDSLARQVEEQTRDLKLANVRLAHAARMKDEFLANMSHELRTPLNAILGLSEALQEEIYGALTERQRTSLGSIEESGHHLLSLINDILDLAKIESGKTDLEMSDVSVVSVCHASLRLIKQIAQKKHLNVSETIDPALSTIWADERRIKQILVNLLTNAVKFTPDGGSVGLEVTGDSDQEVMTFVVWDTGIGIDSEQIQGLFQPFVQLDSGLNRHHEGTGLGLALVSRLTEMHGGSVSVESEVGKGSRFVVSLPWRARKRPAVAASDDLPQSVLPDAETEEGEIPRTPVTHKLHRVLIIEDSPSAAEQVRRYMEQIGVEVFVYTQGNSAMSRVLEVVPDLVVLDIMLPGLSGWDVMATIKSDPRTQHLPVVILSVLDEHAQAMTRGATAYLQKPIYRHQFLAVLFQIFPQMQHDTDGDAGVYGREERSDGQTDPKQERSHSPVLIVEDNEDNIAMLAEYLDTMGYRVEVARSGEEAIHAARTVLPSLILMDIQMPGMDGLEATRRIRAEPDIAHIPIIALTALAMPGDRQRCVDAGANDYMSKPVRLKKLLEVIEHYLVTGA